MTDRVEAFLRGDRPDDVAIYLAESAVDDLDALAAHGARVDDGVLLVLDGERGRRAFESATGLEAMAFAGHAMGTDGIVDGDLTGGTCPDGVGADADAASDGDTDGVDDADGHDTHQVRLVFAFAEEQNESVGGVYAEGDVIHAYARCICGTAYSDRWVVEAADGDGAR